MNFDTGHNGFSIRRIAGLSTAMILHTGVVLFLVAPVRPGDETPRPDPVEPTFVGILERKLPPPPPPPKAPEPPKPVQPVVRAPRPVPQPVTPSPQPSMDTTDVVTESAPIEEFAELAPEPAAGPSFGASLDAAYGGPPKVRYPSALIRKRIEGDVLVRVQLDEEGRVVDVAIARSSGHRALDDSALKQVRTWRFRAAEENGVRVAAAVLVPMRFRIGKG